MKQKLGFINGVDEGQIATVKDLESWRSEHEPFVRASRGTVGVGGFFEGVEELCHMWKYGDMNL